MQTSNIKSPLDEETVKKLKAGDQVFISGVIYTARDAAHKRMVEALDKGEKLPFDMTNQAIYYMGPTPAKPGQVIGSAGPTTSGRMDSYAVRLMAAGLKGMIGKGNRSQAVKDAMKKIQGSVLRRLEVENFPATVINDIYGGDLYEQGKAKYQVKV